MGAADVSSEKLRMNLEAEAQGEGASRGIHPTHPNMSNAQTFEIFLPPTMLSQYSKVYFSEVNKRINDVGGDKSPISAAFSTDKALPDGLNMGPLEKKQRLMNKIMKKYIEKVSSDPGTWLMEAKERHWSDKLLGLHPNIGGIWSLFECGGGNRRRNMDDENQRKEFPIMYSDPGLPSYSKILLYGLDFDFMILECLVIACMDRCNYLPNGIQSGMAFGVLMAFLFDSILIGIRGYVGRRNLARHTLSDERFMIA